jgi:hypothetical protein
LLAALQWDICSSAPFTHCVSHSVLDGVASEIKTEPALSVSWQRRVDLEQVLEQER